MAGVPLGFNAISRFVLCDLRSATRHQNLSGASVREDFKMIRGFFAKWS